MNLDETRIFVKVVQLGSFSKAAEVLKAPKSTVSRAVSRLERDTGAKLLLRTTRNLTLTAAGRAFFEVCAGPLQILEDAQRTLHGEGAVPRGPVRLTAPEDLGSSVISRTLAALSLEQPGLRFELVYTDRIVDLVKEGFDMAIRLGKLAPSRFKTAKLGAVQLVLVASPDYLRSAPKIRAVGDLRGHACLSYAFSSANPRWSLRSRDRTESVVVEPKITSNQMTSLLSVARKGAGVAFVPRYLCEEAVQRGELVRVLPEWAGADLPCTMVLPISADSSARLRLVADRLKADLRAVLRV